MPASAPSAPATRSERKHAAIIAAAAEVFLDMGYDRASMDEIAARSSVSKQTVYKHFSSKDLLFVAVVTEMMDEAGAAVHRAPPNLRDRAELEAFLLDYGIRIQTVALTPGLMQLRRLVISEVQRFPELARELYARGAGRAIGTMGALFETLREDKLLAFDDAAETAAQLNWLLMGEPVNRVMMLGNDAIPTTAEIRRHTKAAIATFLAAFLHPEQC
ncbi:TetR/AcrR family transcriptional regulator [Devosia sp.]|uniref:TetR/AcrR family transcriptional regulator n=1 Tax=Devosia sp. TaxID=1871048 RepID=UPI002FCB3039